jgi:hypothetical protein
MMVQSPVCLILSTIQHWDEGAGDPPRCVQKEDLLSRLAITWPGYWICPSWETSIASVSGARLVGCPAS